MSALYLMRYQGVAWMGLGAIYVGKGKVLGIDVTGARYDGAYTSQGTTISGTAVLTPTSGTLVTGQLVTPGSKVPIAFTLPADLGDGQFQTVMVGGRPVQVAFDKIGDIP